jgi:LAO/AO transport system kinase
MLATLPATQAPEGGSHVLGVTGPPGVGKSTLVNGLVQELNARGDRVAVLAVDPSSPFRGGALLGDRIRMGDAAKNADVYIRSMATRGVLGGLARAAWAAVELLSAWGFHWIVVETAGVGQNEVDIVDLAETTMLVISPAAGDDVQVMKAGIMEIADIFVVNKSDLPGADRIVDSLRSMLPDHDPPEVYRTRANAALPSSGIPELSRALAARSDANRLSGSVQESLARRRRAELRSAAMDILGRRVDEELARLPDPEPGGDGQAAPAPPDPYCAGREIVRRIVRGEKHGNED